MHRSLRIILSFLLGVTAAAQDSAPAGTTDTSGAGLEIVRQGSYPELRIDGAPFFIHSAAFSYYRIPRVQWEESLDHHRELGINTIDLYIPWNWHEPEEGAFDFDGRTNPRRDLRALLRLIADRGFKLIARPGPVILNEWRHGGYPEWLLERAEFEMPVVDRLEGRYPPLAGLNARDAEAAARGWLANAAHMEAARRWLAAVAAELEPHSFRRRIEIPVPSEKRGEMPRKEVSGPLLFVQLDDDYGLGRANTTGAAFWRYAAELRRMVEAGGLDVPVFINPVDFRIPAAGSAQEKPIGIMGQWYLQAPPAMAEGTPATPRMLTAFDATAMEFAVETLKTQPNFPPMLIEYQAGWYTPGDDARPQESHPANTLLSTRVLLAHGLKGLNHFPLQDTLTPAGYSTPWTNRHYRWDAALSLSGERQARARSVQRTGQVLELWGELLASSHKRADFGVVHPIAAFPQEQLERADVHRVAGVTMRLMRLAQLAGLSLELVDAYHQPLEQLRRHRLLLLPTFDPAAPRFRMSEQLQRALVEYVHGGGTLVVFPGRPAGDIFSALWTSGQALSLPADPASAVSAAWSFGAGRYLESTKDFFSWIALDASWADNRDSLEAAWSIGVLKEFLARAGLRPVVRRGEEPGDLLVTQLAAHSGALPLGGRRKTPGLLSVSNLHFEDSVEETLRVLSPGAGARLPDPPGPAEADYIPLRLTMPPRESLLLPLHFSLCSAARPGLACNDELIAAGAELLSVWRDRRTLELTFYTPSRATLLLRLERKPRRITLDEMRPEPAWDPASRKLSVEILRGAAPDYLRVVRIEMPYTPHVAERPDPSRRPRLRRDFDYRVFDAMRLPLGNDTSLPAHPPLLLVDPARPGRMLIQARNHDDRGRELDLRVEGPLRGDTYLDLGPDELDYAPLTLRGNGSAASRPGAATQSASLLRGELHVRAGRDRRSTPIYFAFLPETGAAHYEFDFDGDGAAEWALENAELRLIVSPRDGGRALALVDKAGGLNMTTPVGLFRDHFAFTPNPLDTRPDRARGAYGLFNRSYEAVWTGDPANPALRMRYAAPDVFPAGAAIEKIMRLAEQDSVEVDYEVALNPGEVLAEQQQAFVSVHSMPVTLRGDRSTRFCWTADGENQRVCHPFVPGGAALDLPEGVTRLEVETPGRMATAFVWEQARATVEMKRHSALLRLRFPPLAPGGEPGRYRIGVRALPVP